MKPSIIFRGLFKLCGRARRAELAAARCSGNSDAKSPQSDGRLPTIEIDVDFEDLEEKTALQSDTSYLDRFVHYF